MGIRVKLRKRRKPSRFTEVLRLRLYFSFQISIVGYFNDVIGIVLQLVLILVSFEISSSV